MSIPELAPLNVLVIGTGRAGQARIRAVQSVRDTVLQRAWSIRKDGRKGINNYLQSNALDLVIICTENGLHSQLIAQALQAKANVLVEFPLVNSSVRAEELWRLAQNNQTLLCECIALLTPTHQLRKERLRTGSWRELRVQFQAGVYRWIEREIQEGNIGQLAIGRLQALWDLTGKLSLEKVQYSAQNDGYRVQIWLRDAARRLVFLEETRRKEGRRGAEWFVDGMPFPAQHIPSPQPLFEKDLELAVQHLKGAQEYYLSKEACLGVLRLAEEISKQL